jgi:hypothetical protein
MRPADMPYCVIHRFNNTFFLIFRLRIIETSVYLNPSLIPPPFFILDRALVPRDDSQQNTAYGQMKEVIH